MSQYSNIGIDNSIGMGDMGDMGDIGICLVEISQLFKVISIINW